MDNITKDEFGPELIVKVFNKKIGVEGFLVVDNTALGMGKGGIRMTPTVTVEEVARLARTMTWKNALAGIPFGGAKAGIVWKGGSQKEKMAVVQHFAKEISLLIPKKYIAGPDVNTGETEMAWFVGATGNWKSATGKPATLCMKVFGKKGEKCGIPHEFGSTGWGVAQSTKTAAEVMGIDIKGATIAIHGFGNVGTFAYTYLTEMGAKVVLIADKDGAVYSAKGFNPVIMKDIIKNKKPVTAYRGAKKVKSEDFWKIPVDILIPASVTDVIHDKNKKFISTKLIVEAGNIPMQERIEEELFKKGIMFVPDFVANAGGVISSYAEYRGYNPKKMFDTVKEKIIKTTALVMKKSLKDKINPRKVGMEVARKRVVEKSHMAG
ncbi:MAG: Glu/Leu/Phe/Val dehydrogenase [Candidatus Staskawiczbacteria bacterium]|nr:Glu/Leu/Phe/Val dehydrogenase [Candidatus Staskawiczbacteria bacterium]